MKIILMSLFGLAFIVFGGTLGAWIGGVLVVLVVLVLIGEIAGAFYDFVCWLFRGMRQ